MSTQPTTTATEGALLLDELARRNAERTGYTGEISRTLPADWKPEPSKKKAKADGYGRRRYRCDADGEGFSVHHTGLGSKCPTHPDAMQHDWRMGGGMAEAEAWLRARRRALPNEAIEEAIEGYDPTQGWSTTLGELAMCWSLFTRWGGLPKDGGEF